MDLARSWDYDDPDFPNVREDVLNAWLEEHADYPVTLDMIWDEVLHARRTLDHIRPKDRPYALADLYCAAYRWALANAQPNLSEAARHRHASQQALAEVRAARLFKAA